MTFKYYIHQRNEILYKLGPDNVFYFLSSKLEWRILPSFPNGEDDEKIKLYYFPLKAISEEEVVLRMLQQ